MSRYLNNIIIKTPTNKLMRSNIKYPDIRPSESDLYITTRIGDSFGELAYSYYGDYNLWWVISISNPNLPQNSYYPPLGTQLRIPSNNRISSITQKFNQLNDF